MTLGVCFSQLFCQHDTNKSEILLGQRSRGSAGPCVLRAPSSHARGSACKSRALSEGNFRGCSRSFAVSDEVAGSGPRSIGDVFADPSLPAAEAEREPSCRVSIILIKYILLYLAVRMAPLLLLLPTEDWNANGENLSAGSKGWC